MSEPARRISGSAETGQPRNGYLYRSLRPGQDSQFPPVLRFTGLAATRIGYGQT